MKTPRVGDIIEYTNPEGGRHYWRFVGGEKNVTYVSGGYHNVGFKGYMTLPNNSLSHRLIGKENNIKILLKKIDEQH